MKTDTLEAPHQSVLTKKQKRVYRHDFYVAGSPTTIIAEVRYDDECGNGHNTFSITGSIYTATRIHGEETVTHKGSARTLYCSGGGCIHEEIAKYFPELAPLIKWHLFDSTGPMHYVSNTLYHAGNRDHWGLEKDEFRQHTSRGKNQAGGVEGVPCWELVVEGLPPKKEIYANEKPADFTVTARWVPHGITGEGKERNLDAARRCALWPEATDEQLCAPPEELKAMLLERLPALVAEFKRDVESLGFVY